jgi:hypothetical protein
MLDNEGHSLRTDGMNQSTCLMDGFVQFSKISKSCERFQEKAYGLFSTLTDFHGYTYEEGLRGSSKSFSR